MSNMLDEFVVELVGVTKRYGSVLAVDDIDLGLRRGEFFSLLGPSGCGKTTTLRLVGGFERPTHDFVSRTRKPHPPTLQNATWR